MKTPRHELVTVVDTGVGGRILPPARTRMASRGQPIMPDIREG
jgi:hypothetical protein